MAFKNTLKLILALVTTTLTLASPLTTLNTTTTVALSTRYINDATLTGLLCNDQLREFGYAHTPRLAEAYKHLDGLRPPDYCNAQMNSCSRVSCSWDTGIWLCNDNDHEINVACPDVSDYVRHIVDNCPGNTAKMLKGQIFDEGNWNVILGLADC